MTKKRISLSTIKPIVNSPASGTKKFVWDTEVRGFGVYKTSEGTPTFVYQYRFKGGRSQRTTLGTLGEFTVESARTFASTLAHEVRTGSDPIAKRKAETAAAAAEVGLLISAYFEDYVSRRRTGNDPMSASQIAVFRRDLLAHLGDKRLDKLTTSDVDKYKAELFARGPSMVRSGLVCLKTLINDGVYRSAFLRTPGHVFDVPKTGKRDRRLTDWEWLRLLEAARDLGDPRGDVVEVLIRLGKRKEEIAELPWEELDMDKRQWRLPPERNKSGKPHLILLPNQVYDIIARQQPDPTKRTGPVFTLNGTAPVEMGSQVKDVLDSLIHRRMELANQRDGTSKRFSHFTIHDTRKIPASDLAEAPFSFSRDTINAMLLHTNGDELDATYILTQLVQEAGDMVQRWNDHVDQQLAGAKAWPGGRELPPMAPTERVTRLADFRAGWPKRADQKGAEASAGDRKRNRRRKD
nr:integrase family protein [Sphingomonas sp. JUb134]